MGRTITPYTAQLEHIRMRFRKFRQSLRKEDQAIFDELMVYAKYHVQAGVMSASPNPFESVLFSIILEQEKRICHLQRKIDSVEEDIKRNLSKL